MFRKHSSLFCRTISDEEEGSVTLTQDVNVLKLFPLSPKVHQNKLDRLPLASFFSS
jgi:hypothetical protein